jgi:phage repressor protein C with HTH and peptisase S24 domain
MIRILKVTGYSLSPSFLSGDYVIVRTSHNNPPAFAKGEIVVARHQALGLIIKQVRLDHPDTETLELEGTHSDSISSEKIGLVPYQDVVGKLLFHIKRPR